MSETFEPQAFGRYYLVDTIAVGGMAEVFKAKSFAEGGFEKLLCIKRILKHLSGNEEFVEMFIDEAKISVELQHPNIVPIYDFGKIQSNYFIAMECVEGKDVKGILRKLAERRKLLPPEYAVYIAHETCKGLDYAHKKANLRGEPLGIIHRDISPSNILVSYTGEVKIADFGIAKARISAYNTKDGVLKGKFEYMSPEQAAGIGISPKSDIFCTGIILHEMLTGRRLFKTDSDVKTLEKIKAVDIEPPGSLNPSVPARLDALVMRALAQDPADRFADAREMQTALMEYLYPSSPDITRESVDRFMHELFATEMDQERMRLDQGSRLAGSMYQAEPDLELDGEWLDENEGSAVTMQRDVNRGSTRLIVGVVVLLLVLIGAGVHWYAGSDESSGKVEVEVDADESLEETTPEPPAPDELIADEPAEESFDFRSSSEVGLEEGEDEPANAQEASEEPTTGSLPARSESSGSRSPPADDPDPDSSAQETSSGSEQAAELVDEGWKEVKMGSVTVGLSGLSWATIYVNDVKRAETAPRQLSLPPGTYTIRVVHEQAGLDEEKSVVIRSGENASLSFSP